ncbi:MAG: hypothetical protein RLY61_697 [Candidatus Parcubacteria bacterium]
MFKLPKKQENINLETELLPTVHSPFEKYLIPVAVILATLVVTVLVVVVLYYLKQPKPVSDQPQTPSEEQINVSPFAPKDEGVKPDEQTEELLDNTIALATGVKVNLDTDWHTLATEDTPTHSMVSFIVASDTEESTDATLVQGEIESYTPEHVFEDVMQTLAKSKEEFSTQTIGSYNVLIRNVYLLTGNAVVGEWKENNKVLLIRVFASSMEEATSIFNRVAQTVTFL